MKNLATIILIFCNLNFGAAQNIDSFHADLKHLLSSAFSTADFDTLMKRHGKLLTHYSYPKEDSVIKADVPFPLKPLRSDTLYLNNIHRLLTSKDVNRRGLAFLLAGATGDSSVTKPLLQSIMVEENETLLFWGSMSLYLLGCQETTALFDLLVKHENKGSHIFLGAYTKLNKDSLLFTGLNRIKSLDKNSRILAAYTLAFASKTRANENALRRAVKKWDISEKGYAIWSLKQLKAGNLHSLLRPLLNHPLTQRIALEALVESPTPNDMRVVKRFIEKDNPVSIDLLSTLYSSSKPEVLKYWLYLLRNRPLSEGGFNCPVYDQPLLVSDQLLPDVIETLKKTSDTRVLQYLSRALQGRSDTQSVDIIMKLLHHPDPQIRYWVAFWNNTCQSPRLAAEIPMLIYNPDLRVLPLVEMAIQNNVDSLHSFFEPMYKNPESSDWKYASLIYLASFPKPEYLPLFIEILSVKNGSQGIGASRYAALGIGRLGDVNSDELIIESSRFWREGSDSNAYQHLLALKMLKTEKAKQEFQYYLNSNVSNMREFARQTLDSW
ncbi:MAG: hypothetical protein IT261_06285 [Saprospiraceae bacterium]|nr:hypothetical protein [Saprospiraceae bacterium]